MSKHHKKSKTTFRQITKERLAGWQQKINEENGTPQLLLGVGHEHNAGKVIIVVTEERSNAEILLFLEYAVKQIRQQMILGN